MHRSSESIAALAAALAKAQIELVNPEKSQVGTIEAKSGHGAQRSFRYAPLANGLDIVRKTLGQHEIATVQTTAIDQTAGMVNLTTVLAHASGEWIASDWPVCSVSESSAPHRMGAALTYARRYALFTLVGIAGEDDLDAPDLIGSAGQATSRSGQRESRESNGASRGGNGPSAAVAWGATRDSRAHPAPKVMLRPDQSAAQREKLLKELESLSSSETAAAWAQRTLAAKNTMTAEDAQAIEQAFAAKLTDLEESASTPSVLDSTAPQGAGGIPAANGSSAVVAPTFANHDGIDKSALTFPEPRRIRDREHVRFVAQQPCLICGRRPADAHHLRFIQVRALGRKVSDEFTVPLCRGHHRELHRCGDEADWWHLARIDPAEYAHKLWRETRRAAGILNETHARVEVDVR